MLPYLQKTWIRILISLFAAAILLNVIFVSMRDPNEKVAHRPGSLFILIFAFVIYLILTAYVKRKTKNY
jgi:hypothetical protein